MAKKSKNTKAAAAPALGKDAAIPATDGGSGSAPAGSTGGQVSAPGSAVASAGDDSRPVWVWRDFARYGAAALILVWLASFVFSTGAGCVRDWREFRQWRQEYRGDGGGGSNPAPAEPLERWIRANLPPASAEEYAEVADVFERVAEKLRSRALAGPRSACAETVAYLTPIAPPRVWGAFLRDLGDRVLRDGAETGDELAELWIRIASAIRSGRAARASDALVRGALGFASPALSSPGREAAAGNIGPSGSDGGPSGSLAADGGLPKVGGEAPAGDLLPTADAAVAEAVEEEAAPEPVEETGDAGKDCPTGNCPANGGANYGGWYWPYYGGGVR